MTSSWRTLSSKTLIQDRWIDVRADRCLTASGVEISPYYVLTYPDWVHVVALTPERRVVLVKQYRHAAAKTFLELPGGCVDASDRDVEQAARRELREETGYVSDHWIYAGALFPNPAIQTNRVHTFVALDAAVAHAPRLDPGEDGMVSCSIPLDEVSEQARGGAFGQALHVSSLFLAMSTLQQIEDAVSPSC